MLNDDASVKGRGADIMLPAQGNPFGGPDQAAPEGVYAVGADAAASAAPVLEAAPELAVEAPAEPEPHDLSPEDLAALFPSGAADRDAALDLSDADLTSATTLGADAELPEHEPAPAAAFQPAAPVTAPGAGFGVGPVAGGAEVGGLPGLPGLAGAEVRISPDLFMVSGPQAYQPGQALVAKEDLVKLFVPDNRLVTLWAEIDSLEQDVTTKVRGVSRKMAEELLDRLSAARNFLMNDRANYEEAVRQVAEVRYRMSRAMGSDVTQQPRFILIFLLFMLVLVVLGFRFTDAMRGAFGGTVAGSDFGLVWSTLLWGGIGGVTGALYGLWSHVAQKQDYDPQFALWYYTNPLMGFLLGGLAFLLIKLGMGAATGGQTIDPAPYTFYVLAFAVGFQQNLAFSLLNNTLKKLIPQEETAPEKSKPEKPAAENKG